MRFRRLATWAPLLALASAAAEVNQPLPTLETDQLASRGLVNLNQTLGGDCTFKNAAQRREWSTLLPAERKSYTDAVLCLMSKPSRTDPKLVPGAKTRYDDFLWVHINQTLTIHGTANFLSWHRWFTWNFEQALRNECGYEGYQPYWNWGKWSADPLHSPFFDGSEYSMSGNGVYQAHNCTNALPTNLNCIPPGQGGGCVSTGPFKNMTVNLGPLSVTMQGISTLKANNGSVYNPRCLRRDISSWVSSQWGTELNSTTLITENPDVYWFQTVMQGDFATGFYGVHTAGHFTFGGDPGGDIFASPGDPMFWLHHGQIDRTWWIWQNQDIKNRQNAISGTITLNNNPPSRNGTLDDLVDLGVVADPIPIHDLMSTTEGPMCYVYV